MKKMRIYFDTEFIEDGKTIDIISIGLIRADGATYYAEFAEADLSRATEWLEVNVLPYLTGETKPREVIAQEILEFCGPNPEFVAHYAAYDWVALAQLYGRLIDKPVHWPFYCKDFQQMREGIKGIVWPENKAEHHALADACWLKEADEALQEFLDRQSQGADAQYQEETALET